MSGVVEIARGSSKRSDQRPSSQARSVPLDTVPGPLRARGTRNHNRCRGHQHEDGKVHLQANAGAHPSRGHVAISKVSLRGMVIVWRRYQSEGIGGHSICSLPPPLKCPVHRHGGSGVTSGGRCGHGRFLLFDPEAVVQVRTRILQEARLAAPYPKCAARTPSAATRIPCACSCRIGRPPPPCLITSQLRSLCRLRQRSETLGQAVQLPGTRKVSGGCPGRCLVGQRG